MPMATIPPPGSVPMATPPGPIAFPAPAATVPTTPGAQPPITTAPLMSFWQSVQNRKLSSAGYDQLLQLLQSGGRTDPAILNRQIASSATGTMGTQQAQAGQAAGRGLANSGVAQAIQAATGAAGQSRIAGIKTADNEAAAQRQIQILELFGQLVGNPNMQLRGIESNESIAGQQQDTAQRAAMISMIGSLFGAGGIAAANAAAKN